MECIHEPSQMANLWQDDVLQTMRTTLPTSVL